MLCKEGGNREYKYCEFLGEEHDYIENKRACPWTNRLCHNPDPDPDLLGRYTKKPRERTSAYFESMEYFFYKNMLYNVVEHPADTKSRDMTCDDCDFKNCINFQDKIPECSRDGREDKRNVYFVFAK